MTVSDTYVGLHTATRRKRFAVSGLAGKHSDLFAPRAEATPAAAREPEVASKPRAIPTREALLHMD